MVMEFALSGWVWGFCLWIKSCGFDWKSRSCSRDAASERYEAGGEQVVIVG